MSKVIKSVIGGFQKNLKSDYLTPYARHEKLIWQRPSLTS
jgi:hypothetical protein